MNRLLYILLISFLTILGFTMFEQKDLGHIGFRFAGLAFETNLVVFTATLLTVMFAALTLRRLLGLIRRVFHKLGSRRKHRLATQARHALTEGLINYTEGRFEAAEKSLLNNIDHSDNPLVACLFAARACQKLGAHERRDEHLGKAYQLAPEAAGAIGITKAELQLAHAQNEQALATLTQLHQQVPEHSRVLRLLVDCCQRLQDWDQLAALLPALKKHGKLSDEHFLAFEIAVGKGQLALAARQHDVDTLLSRWQQIASHLQQHTEILEHYARLLIRHGAAGEAEAVLRDAINRHWQQSTIELYSQLDLRIDNRKLETVESWLQQQPNNASLLLALGKLCTRLSLWGKARNYLEASIAIRPTPETCLWLARLLEEHMKELSAAREYYRQGLHLLAGDDDKDTPDRVEHDFQQESPQLKIVKN